MADNRISGVGRDSNDSLSMHFAHSANFGGPIAAQPSAWAGLSGVGIGLFVCSYGLFPRGLRSIFRPPQPLDSTTGDRSPAGFRFAIDLP